MRPINRLQITFLFYKKYGVFILLMQILLKIKKFNTATYQYSTIQYTTNYNELNYIS